MFYPFSRIALFVVSVLGWGGVFFGGWIAARGMLFYDWDPVLMGTGGGIALGGLLVTALTIGAQAQIATARDTAALLKATEARPIPMPSPPTQHFDRTLPGPMLRTVTTPPVKRKAEGARPEPKLTR